MPAIINYRPQELEGWIKEGRLGMEEGKRRIFFSFFNFILKSFTRGISKYLRNYLAGMRMMIIIISLINDRI